MFDFVLVIHFKDVVFVIQTPSEILGGLVLIVVFILFHKGVWFP